MFFSLFNAASEALFLSPLESVDGF